MRIRKAGAPASSRRRRVTVALVCGLLIAPALAGCAVNPLESVVESVTGGNVDLGGTTIPADFPTEVPLVDGEVVNAIGVGTAPEKVWTVTVKVADASVLEAIKGDLEAAGFSSALGDAAVGNLTGGMYSNGARSVLIVVAEEKDGGWLVTYTVAPVAK